MGRIDADTNEGPVGAERSIKLKQFTNTAARKARGAEGKIQRGSIAVSFSSRLLAGWRPRGAEDGMYGGGVEDN